MIGTVLDKYEVLRKVGEGGMATVYLGRHTTLNRRVAIKVLHPHLSSSTRNRRRFAREARAIEHLRHENILEIFDYSGTDSKDCYIVTEFVDGETLNALLQRVGRIPSEVATSIGIRLAEALAYAHAAGILHRDLKPENVMIRADGTIKLMDFGIARFLDESQVTMTGALVGSPAYMSPEQAREEDLDARSDLFSLGTLLFHLVTGQLPFSGSNPSLILKNIIEGNRPGLQELAPAADPNLADVVERLMQSDREARIRSAEQLALELRTCLAKLSLTETRPGLALPDYLEDAAAYERRLEEYLRTHLLEIGREHLERGDHLEALQLFNRLLAIDEDNHEVLDLVQGLHGREKRERPRRLLMIFSGGLAAIGALGLWRMGRQPEVPSSMPEEEPVADVDDEQPPVLLPFPVSPVEPAPREAAPPSPPAPTPVSNVELSRPKTAGRNEPSIEAEPPSPAWVEIRSQTGLYANIYENDHLLGDVRQPEPVEVPAGEHVFVLRSDTVLQQELRLTVAPGELAKRVVELRPRPLDVVIDPSFSDACVVYLNGDTPGTVGQLTRKVELTRPDRENTIVLECEDGVHKQEYKSIHTLYPVFARVKKAP